MALTEKLLNVQAKLKAPKGQFNNFGKYHYRSCEDILEAVKPLLKAEGLALTINDSMQLVGDRVYVKATAMIYDGENDICVSAFAREAATKKGMDDAQITGAASSYARKYALNGMFLIDDTKDADTNGSQAISEECISDEQLNTLLDLISIKDVIIEKFLVYMVSPQWIRSSRLNIRRQ